MKIIVFEQFPENFYPISNFRPLWEIKSGLYTFRERLEKLIATRLPETAVFYKCRKELTSFARLLLGEDIVNPDLKMLNDEVLFINSFVSDLSFVDNLEIDTVYMQYKTVVAAYVSVDKICDGFEILKSYELLNIIEMNEIFIPDYIWSIVLNNGDYIRKDFDHYTKENSAKAKKSQKDATIIGDSALIFIEEGAIVDPFVIFDLRKGPVLVRKNTVINSFSSIEGPCFIDENCTIIGAKVREGCSIGRNCKIGGEVEDSIFHSYSNKCHEGFIGHSYVGEWVNLGALTTNSDLKNDYSSVKCALKERVIDTGEIKVGALIGDFSKTSIGTLLNTGAVLGSGCMVVHTGKMVIGSLPDFSWFIKNEIRNMWTLERFIATTSKVMKRRNCEMSAELEKIISSVYDDVYPSSNL